jgi:hypothetical protein
MHSVVAHFTAACAMSLPPCSCMPHIAASLAPAWPHCCPPHSCIATPPPPYSHIHCLTTACTCHPPHSCICHIATHLTAWPCHCVKAIVGLDVHAETLTKCSGPDGNEKGNVPLGNPTLPEDLAETAELLAQTSVLRRTLALLYPLNR